MPSSKQRGGKGAKGRFASAKRAPLPLRSDFTPAFVKAWRRYELAGRINMADVKKAMNLIVNNDGPLPAEYRDHALSGAYDGYRDCHVHGDHLLIYKVTGDSTTVIFTEMGTHSELFGK